MKQTLTNSELSVFSQQLVMILHSGISVLEGISILRDDTPEGEGRDILSGIYESLEMTGELAQALQESKVYPDYFIKMTEIGERSGTLEEVMASLSDHYARQDALMRSIKDALVYPVVLLGMLLAVLVVLMTQVMPVFQEVFEQLGMEMTGVSAAVFRISNILQKVSVVLLVLFAAAVLGCLIALRTQKGRNFLMKLVLRLPLGRKVSELMNCAWFSTALALALHSGLDMNEGFELAAGLCQEESFCKKTSQAGEMVSQGNDLADALKDSGIITGLNARMVSMGFHTGSAETALSRIAMECQEEAEQRIGAAMSALEPTLTAVLSILTGAILVSVMLPLLGVMANIG